MNHSFSDPVKKIACITGASRGIGRAIAIKFAQEGYNLVLICHNNLEMLNRLKAELTEAYSVEILVFALDLADGQNVKELFATLPTPDVLVNNAGISHIGLLQDMTDAQWNQVIGTNLSSCFYTSRSVISGMLQRGNGAILNISSVWGGHGASMEVAYSASKGGVEAFTKALAKELAPSHITVNAIACGFIDTEMNGHLSEEEKQFVIDEIPASRMGTTEEVADFVYRIATSPAYLTGQVITFDGAWM